jgi:uncharacterized protein
VPYGSPIDGEKLARIDRAEAAVRMLGFSEFRVRHLGPLARIEVGGAELERALAPEMTERLVAVAVGAGFDHASVDREAFRSGRLNRDDRPAVRQEQ